MASRRIIVRVQPSGDVILDYETHRPGLGVEVDGTSVAPPVFDMFREALRRLVNACPRCQYGGVTDPPVRCDAPALYSLCVPDAGRFCESHAPDGYDELEHAPALREAIALLGGPR
jgi:hypothetical protein